MLACSAEGITTSPPDSATQEKLLTLAKNVKNLVVFSGSGLSAGSGQLLSQLHMSTDVRHIQQLHSDCHLYRDVNL